MANRPRRLGGPPDPFRVRRAGIADLDLLVRHRQGMWRAIGIFTEPEIRRGGPPYRDWVRRQIRARRFFGFVVETTDGRPAGSGGVWLQPVQPRPGAFSREVAPYILSMFTDEEFRGRGVATRLVETMIDWARSRGYPRITLHASKQGHSVYHRLGFDDSNEMRYNLRSLGPGRPASSARRAR